MLYPDGHVAEPDAPSMNIPDGPHPIDVPKHTLVVTADGAFETTDAVGAAFDCDGATVDCDGAAVDSPTEDDCTLQRHCNDNRLESSFHRPAILPGVKLVYISTYGCEDPPLGSFGCQFVNVLVHPTGHCHPPLW